MGYELNRYDKPTVVSCYHTSTVSDYQRIRRKLGAAYFYLSPEEKKEYIRSYFRKFR